VQALREATAEIREQQRAMAGMMQSLLDRSVQFERAMGGGAIPPVSTLPTEGKQAENSSVVATTYVLEPEAEATSVSRNEVRLPPPLPMEQKEKRARSCETDGLNSCFGRDVDDHEIRPGKEVAVTEHRKEVHVVKTTMTRTA
jgi:hypothetical protein